MQYLTRPQFQNKFALPAVLLGLFLVCGVGLLACGPAVTPVMVEKPAPIESVSIEVSAAEPSVADLVVESGLPNSCYTFGHYSVSREGDTFRVEIVNLIPDDPMLACAEVYGMITTRIPLEGGVDTCKFYDVVVNDAPYSVQAIAPNVRCKGPLEDYGQLPEDSVVLAFGEKTPIAGTDLALTLIDVPEDSRCPRDVVCVWAGRATAVLGVELDGKDLGELSLTLEGGAGSALETIEGYTIKLLRLEPYPVSTGQILAEEYQATVSVTVG
ncbi:MAG TPA: hypothetical protein VFR55_15045 [Dehalococcoidia bacterium]|nr:hypothetical protein [Dehalococcoidia bacterium]